VSAGREKQSAAAVAGERVRAVLEAAEQSAADLRAEAAQEIEAQLAKAQAVAERLAARADEIERSLQALADGIRDELASLRADLEELRAVGEGIASAPDEPAPAAKELEPEEITPEEAAPAAEDAAPEPPAPERASAEAPAGAEGARVIALNMALNGSSREETAHYLSENFELDDPEALLDEVYARVSG
jgi:ABC-type transporter Mla subunit MlaD